jgi:hypothetical protein
MRGLWCAEIQSGMKIATEIRRCNVDHQGTIMAWKGDSALLTSLQEMANSVMGPRARGSEGHGSVHGDTASRALAGRAAIEFEVDFS